MNDPFDSKAKTSGYEAFKAFTAVRIHYVSDSYDFFKYNGETKAVSFEGFRSRKDKYSFVRLGRIYNREDLIYFLGVNFYEKSSIWIHDLFLDSPHLLYKEWKARQTPTSRVEELTRLVSSGFKDLIAVHEDQHPRLLEKLLGKEVHPDTVCLADKSVKFTEQWLSAYPKDPVVNGMVSRLHKYSRFVQNVIHYDTSTYDKIIQEHTSGKQ